LFKLVNDERYAHVMFSVHAAGYAVNHCPIVHIRKPVRVVEIGPGHAT
jgi:hypothetical protein